MGPWPDCCWDETGAVFLTADRLAKSFHDCSIVPIGTKEAFMSATVQDQPRPPLPPFSWEDAVKKVRAAEDAWNGRNPARIALAYTSDSVWRNRSEFLRGRQEIEAFLTRKWEKEHDYRLIKELWAYGDHRIAVRFVYEWRNEHGQWFRSHGNENWEFAANGLMQARHASINDVPITQEQRLFLWDRSGPRPADHPGLTELGL
ncbi:Hypothetical protein GbCGDNIH7_0862 [Granulibacter bethesdensis]|nr:Hypothetical protein GbCGDNIH7_0862 [Granulibacter bethesdensis]